MVWQPLPRIQYDEVLFIQAWHACGLPMQRKDHAPGHWRYITLFVRSAYERAQAAGAQKILGVPKTGCLVVCPAPAQNVR
ncbi:MAG TPA: hypothetical protein VLF71_02435 [Candidatus Saccharimonadales bacterium]|nr:hypothetical protein [Candidatus Saccharimonadales bacterium]